MSNQSLTLTLYPNQHGMGYLISNSPKDIINYGIARIAPLSHDKYIRRMKSFVDRYKPDVIILKGCDGDYRISKRVQRVVKIFTEKAEQLNLNVYQYRRNDIKQVFEQFGKSTTKFNINSSIAEWYPELKSKLPDIRRNNYNENYFMGIFDAFSLMLTHHYLQ
jgi:competence CoiA-like predicted nuclease